MKNTLVLDVGKSNTRLLLVDAAGELRWSESRPSRSVDDGVHGLRALDTQGLAHWLEATIPQVPDRRDLDSIMSAGSDDHRTGSTRPPARG